LTTNVSLVRVLMVYLNLYELLNSTLTVR